MWNGYRNSYRLDHLTRHAMPGVYRQKIAFDGDHHESLLLNTIDRPSSGSAPLHPMTGAASIVLPAGHDGQRVELRTWLHQL